MTGGGLELLIFGTILFACTRRNRSWGFSRLLMLMLLNIPICLNTIFCLGRQECLR